jgi:hypothetical protein
MFESMKITIDGTTKQIDCLRIMGEVSDSFTIEFVDNNGDIVFGYEGYIPKEIGEPNYIDLKIYMKTGIVQVSRYSTLNLYDHPYSIKVTR